jgi:hypothetical protein
MLSSLKILLSNKRHYRDKLTEGSGIGATSNHENRFYACKFISTNFKIRNPFWDLSMKEGIKHINMNMRV